MSRRHLHVQLLNPNAAVGDCVEFALADTASTLDHLEESARQLRRHGLRDVGEDLCQMTSALRMDLKSFLTWMTEAEASEYTGHAKAWLRSHFPEMAVAGQAREREGKREYRQIALLAKRQDQELAEARARAAARLGLDRGEAA